jgi:hypothetical protein
LGFEFPGQFNGILSVCSVLAGKVFTSNLLYCNQAAKLPGIKITDWKIADWKIAD